MVVTIDFNPGRLGGGMPLFLEDSFRTHMFPYPLLDEANGNDVGTGSGMASMSRLSGLAHPLLVGRQPPAPDGSASAASGRNRGGRQRGYRYLQTSSRVPNPPAILQRLLGPSATHDVLQLTGGQVVNTEFLHFWFVCLFSTRMISSLIVFLPSFKFIALTFSKKKFYQQFNSIKFELVDVKNEYLRINFWNFYFFVFSLLEWSFY